MSNLNPRSPVAIRQLNLSGPLVVGQPTAPVVNPLSSGDAAAQWVGATKPVTKPEGLIPDEAQYTAASLEKGSHTAAGDFDAKGLAQMRNGLGYPFGAESLTLANRFASTSAILGKAGDAMDGLNFLAAASEFKFDQMAIEASGIFGQGVGATAGAEIFSTGFALVFPELRVAGAMFGGYLGAEAGNDYAKDAAVIVVEQTLLPPPLPADLKIAAPHVVDAEGTGYVLANVDGKNWWYAIQKDSTVAAGFPRYTPMYPSEAVALTDAVMKEVLPAEGYATYKQQSDEIRVYGNTVENIQTANRDSFRQSEINRLNADAFAETHPTLNGTTYELGRPSVNADGIGTLVVPNPTGDGFLKITSVPNGAGGVIQHIETYGPEGGQATQLQIVGPGVSQTWVRGADNQLQLAPAPSTDVIHIGQTPGGANAAGAALTNTTEQGRIINHIKDRLPARDDAEAANVRGVFDENNQLTGFEATQRTNAGGAEVDVIYRFSPDGKLQGWNIAAPGSPVAPPVTDEAIDLFNGTDSPTANETSPTTPSPTPVPYTLPNGNTGTAYPTPDRPALISDEDGHSYQIDIHGNLTLPSDTLPGDGRITPVSYQPGDSAPAPAGDASPTPPQAPPAPLYDPNSLFLGNLGADNPYVCRPDDPPLDPDSQAPAPVETATPRPVGGGLSDAERAHYGTGAINNMVNLIQAIEQGNDLSAVLAGIGLMNNAGQLVGAGNVIPTELGTGLGAVSSLINLGNALDNGDALGALLAGTNLASQGANLWSNYAANVAFDAIEAGGMDLAAEAAASQMGALAQGLGQVLPVLSIINSLANGDTTGAVISAISMAFPPLGIVLSLASAFGMFDDEPDIPVAVGNAAAHWDEAGGVAIATTYDEAGGGSTANAWLNNLVRGLQAGLAGRIDESGRPLLYGLDPTRLPGIGYAFDADTGDGYLRLSWTDPDGTPQWRQYDTSGMRNDGQSVAGINDLARDFVFHASDAILPAWEADTRFQQGGDATAPAALFTGAVSADGASIARTVLSLGAGATATTTTASLDLDGDGYLESTQWTASPLLAVDLNGDGRVSAFELVDGRAGGDARNSLARLDANGDGVLDAGDPAFAALALWSDINGNGVVDAGEAGSLADAGIASLGYAGEAVTVGRTDGGGDTLNRTTLAGDTLGLARWLNEDGLYEAVEDGDTTLFAINQHDFDGDPDHVHGGLASPDARPASPPTPPRTSIPIAPFAFVPAAAATPARAVREVTREMIASADDGLFGAGHRGSATLGGPEVSRFQYNHKHIRRTTTTY